MNEEDLSPKILAEIEAAKKELAELTKEEQHPNGGEKTEKEDLAPDQDSPEREYTEVEKEQMAKGWDPNHEGGVSAEEFKRVGEIIEAKRKASRTAKKKSVEVERLQNTVKKLVEHNRKIEQAMYEKAARELYAEKMKAVEEGDKEAVQEIERQQAALKPPAMDDFEVQANPTLEKEDISQHPDVIAFREDFKAQLTGTTVKDKAFQAYIAKRAYELEQDPSQTDISASVNLLREELKELFPTKTENPNKSKPALTEKSTTRSYSTSTSVSSLSYEDRALFNDIRKADPTYTEKEFLAQLELAKKKR